MLLPVLRQIEQKALVERSARGLRAAAPVYSFQARRAARQIPSNLKTHRGLEGARRSRFMTMASSTTKPVPIVSAMSEKLWSENRRTT
jgi:hypothetical protein